MSRAETETFELVVAGVGLWLPGVPNLDAWRAGARGADPRQVEVPPPTGASIEPRARRRASTLCRALTDAYDAAASQAGVDKSQTGAVFGSALGEVTTMLSLLDQMSRNEELSPMAFGTSVHSAAAGTVSISTKNRGFTTSISANHDTAAAALFEAGGVVETMGSPVIVACGDESSPDRFVDDAEAFDMVAVAIAFVPAGSDGPVLARLRGPFRGTPTIPPAEVRDRIGRNPQAGLVDLVAAIVGGAEGVVGLDRGRGSGWCVEVAGAGR